MQRRRFITLTVGATLGMGSLGLLGVSRAQSSPNTLNTANPDQSFWRGILFGAQVTIHFIGVKQAQVDAYLPQLLKKMQQLEGSFSLYQSDSELTRLNQQGVLDEPSTQFVELMQQAQYYHQLTNGVFDPTVETYATNSDKQPMSKVSFDKVVMSKERVSYRHSGIKCTLNGIAQGYITDCMVTELESQGWGQALVNFGEYYAMDNNEHNQPWNLKIQTQQSLQAHALSKGRALAVSSGVTQNLMGDDIPHLYHPELSKSGNVSSPALAPRSSFSWVEAPNATCADALSTAYAVMTPKERVQLQQACQQQGLDVSFGS